MVKAATLPSKKAALSEAAFPVIPALPVFPAKAENQKRWGFLRFCGL